MTKVFQLFEEEKQEAVKEAVEETKRKKDRKYTEALLNKGMSIEDIADVTGLSTEGIEQIQQDILVLEQ